MHYSACLWRAKPRQRHPATGSVVAALGRREALDAAQQLVFGDGVEGVAIGVGIRVEQRRGVLFGLVDFDVFLQRVDEVLAKVFRRNGAIADLAERNDGILVVVAVDGDLADPAEIMRARWAAIRTRSKRFSTFSMQSSTVTRATDVSKGYGKVRGYIHERRPRLQGYVRQQQ